MRPPILQDGKSVVRFAIFGQNRGFGSFWEIFRLRMTVAIERAVKLYGTTICVLCSLQLVVTFCCDWSSIALGVFKSETKATNSCLMERSKVFFKKKNLPRKCLSCGMQFSVSFVLFHNGIIQMTFQISKCRKGLKIQ